MMNWLFLWLRKKLMMHNYEVQIVNTIKLDSKSKYLFQIPGATESEISRFVEVLNDTRNRNRKFFVVNTKVDIIKLKSRGELSGRI